MILLLLLVTIVTDIPSHTVHVAMATRGGPASTHAKAPAGWTGISSKTTEKSAASTTL